MENASEETRSNSLASAVKRVLDLLSVCPATHLNMFRQKRNTHNATTQQSSLLQKCGKTSLDSSDYDYEPQIITFENYFHIWFNIGYICERTLSAMSCVKSRFRTLYRLQFTISTSLCCYSFRAEFHKIVSWQHQVFYYWWVELCI